ncbi:hypothetical protein FACS189416_2570 [Bacteroidia bacterium]|nr:hypothetical protein FACS189416_2570 [Bacteroidia bacterium]
MKKLLLFLIFAVSFAAQAQDYGKKFSDLNYAGDDQGYHTLDVYLPKTGKTPYPVVIHIYGSAWFSNNSKDNADINTIVKALLDVGFAVVTPNHRSSMDAKFPVQINDIKAVVRFVRGKAAELGFDQSFIGISGCSSGGHLAALTGTTNGITEFRSGNEVVDIEGNLGQFTNESSHVNAVCDWFGPVDVLNIDSCRTQSMFSAGQSPETALMGYPVKDNRIRSSSASAITYVDPSDPPFLLIHGDKDALVPYCQSKDLDAALKKAGVKSEYIQVAGGEHYMGTVTDANIVKMVGFFRSILSPQQSFSSGNQVVQAPGKPAATNVRRALFPSILPDNSVMFRVNAPNAQKVQIDFGGKYDLVKKDGVFWEGVTDPQSEGFHYYSLVIDDVAVCDPASETYFGMSRMASGIEIPYPEGVNHFYIADVPHGDVRMKRYFSKTANEWRRMYVYTPPGYDTSGKKYPVLYIQHGGGEDERGWAEQGRTDIILDNLIAKKQAVPMLVVMSDGNATDFESELLKECIPFVEKNFRVKTDQVDRVLAGLSMGGIQTLNVGIAHPELFSSLGVFSSGWFASTPPGFASMGDSEKYYTMLKDKKDQYNKQFKHLWLSMGGQEDIAFNNCQTMMKRFDEIGIKYTYYEYPGGHTWPVWRESLYRFAQLLFK